MRLKDLEAELAVVQPGSLVYISTVNELGDPDQSYDYLFWYTGNFCAQSCTFTISSEAAELAIQTLLGVRTPHYESLPEVYCQVKDPEQDVIREFAVGAPKIKKALERRGLEYFCDYVDKVAAVQTARADLP